MEDDIDGAEAGLATGNSAFHQLSKGVLGFVKATLGFEQDIIQEASQQLSEAEKSAHEKYIKAQHDSHTFNSTIYERGSEFALCQAMAQIMAAIVGVLNESLLESVKGFFKLRRAYITLDGLLQMESDLVKSRRARSLTQSRQQSSESLRSTKSNPSTIVRMNPVPPSPLKPVSEIVHAKQPSPPRQGAIPLPARDVDPGDSDEFYEADAQHGGNAATDNYTGHVASEKNELAGLSMSRQVGSLESPGSFEKTFIPAAHNLLTEDATSEVFAAPLDAFIHSGTNLCSGMLSLMISVIPPAFGKLLYIIGFRGDRERGIRLLWQASKFPNINGGLAGLIILGWYNGMIGMCDIIPDSDPSIQDQIEGYPTERLQTLLSEMKARYPRSRLWIVQEALMAASMRQLDRALALLDQPGKSKVKQLEALHMFEKGLASMSAHRYQQCADSFLALADLNSWSQALYFYIAGAAHLSIYRQLQAAAGPEEQAKKHREIAEEYFKAAPARSGKKKLMGRQLPFDAFVNRKIAKWQERAKAFGCPFIDAVGVSPLDEMIFFWNGFKKMDVTQLETSLSNLQWSVSNPEWKNEDLDERAILSILEAVILRNLRRHTEAKRVLRQEILCHDPQAFKGQNKDDWTAPIAHYEMGVNLWMERRTYIKQHGHRLETPETGIPPPDPVDATHDAALVQECRTWIEKTKNWDKYELDVRLGVKVTAAYNTIKDWEHRHCASRSK